MSVQYELISWRWGHTQMRVGGGGGATTHISTESFELEEGGVVQRRLKVPTSCIREGGGAVRRWLELPTSWHEGGAVWLEGEENLP
jgi:hypothetical protein